MGRRLRTAVRTLPGWALQAVAVLVIGYAVGRATWYPFWAAGAAPAELARSWGGPSAVGATLAHWAVAALLVVGGLLLFALGRRLRR